jgi:hypothetical protein
MRSRRFHVLLAVLAVLLICLVVQLQNRDVPERTMTPIEGLDGQVVVDPGKEPGQKVVSVVFIDRPVTDGDLSCLNTLPRFQRLFLDGTRVTDDGMEQVSAFPGLLWLSLCNTAITDGGLERLRELPNLEALFLKNCRGVTDRGADHLRAMKRLRILALDGTQVGAAALQELKAANPRLNLLTARADDD